MRNLPRKAAGMHPRNQHQDFMISSSPRGQQSYAENGSGHSTSPQWRGESPNEQRGGRSAVCIPTLPTWRDSLVRECTAEDPEVREGVTFLSRFLKSIVTP